MTRNHLIPGWKAFCTAVAPLLLLVASCAENPAEAPEERDEHRLEVASFSLAAGETREFAAPFEIVSEGAVDIAGEILVTPDGEGDFVVTSRTGPITISGSVRVVEGAKQSKAPPHHGASLVIEIEEAGGRIDVAALGQLYSGSGRSVPRTLVQSGEELEGLAGGNGGSIVLRAPGGEIRLPEVGGTSSTAPFQVGNGGEGGSYEVDRDAFTTDATQLHIYAGMGGNSGQLELSATTITNLPALADVEPNSLFVSGGIGGAGGSVIWDNQEESILHPGGGSIDRVYPLESIRFVGGDGGDGIRFGGRGGSAVYWSGRTIHERPDPTPSALVQGGYGGDVVPSSLPLYYAKGGDGGEFSAIGNSGIDGYEPDQTASPHGTPGGRVSAFGGGGGSIQEGVLFRRGFGGDGANSALAQTTWGSRLGVGGFSYLDKQFGVISGAGGNGKNRCNGCSGGTGGEAGALAARTGSGGSVPILEGSESFGGQGGDFWHLERGRGSRGGDGNPPGERNCSQDFEEATLRHGGSGQTPGRDGQMLGTAEPFPCPPEAQSCGETLQCEGEIDPDCWTREGSSFYATYAVTTTCPDGEGGVSVYEDIHVEHGVYECNFDPTRPGECRWLVNGSHNNSSGLNETFTGVWNPLNTDQRMVAINASIRPACFDGDLYFPGTTHVITSTSGQSGECTTEVLRSFIGCNPRLLDRTRDEYVCCKVNDDFWRLHYIPLDGTCSEP